MYQTPLDRTQSAMSETFPDDRLSVFTSYDRSPVLGILGRGGFGTVYLAYHPKLHEVAIKALALNLLDDDYARDLFKSEAEMLRSLGGPGIPIVPIHHIGEEPTASGNTRPYFVMDYCSGGTLADRLSEAGHPLTIEEALALAQAIAGALHHVHSAQVVHRDIKPGNLFIFNRSAGTYPSNGYSNESTSRLFSEDEHLVIGDFGLAKLVTPDKSGVTYARGTRMWGAPEQFRPLGDPQVDQSVDVYAASKILVKAISGCDPVVADSPGPPFPNWAFEKCGPLEPTLRRSLSRDRHERPKDISNWLDSLLKAYTKDPINQTTVSAELGEVLTNRVAPPQDGSPQPKRRARILLVGCLSISLTMLLGLLWLKDRDGSSTGPTPPSELAVAAISAGAIDVHWQPTLNTAAVVVAIVSCSAGSDPSVDAVTSQRFSDSGNGRILYTPDDPPSAFCLVARSVDQAGSSGPWGDPIGPIDSDELQVSSNGTTSTNPTTTSSTSVLTSGTEPVPGPSPAAPAITATSSSSPPSTSAQIIVPTLVGLKLDEASQTLKEEGLVPIPVETISSKYVYLVTESSPRAGEKADRGDSVTLTLKPAPTTVTIGEWPVGTSPPTGPVPAYSLACSGTVSIPRFPWSGTNIDSATFSVVGSTINATEMYTGSGTEGQYSGSTGSVTVACTPKTTSLTLRIVAIGPGGIQATADHRVLVHSVVETPVGSQ